MSYSCAKPKPPCVSIAALPASHEASLASSFAMFASAPQRQALLEQPGGLVAHEVGRLDRSVRARERELHALVGADRPLEHDALAGVARRAVEEEAAVADALGRDQHALGVHAVEDVAEAAALLADERVVRHGEVGDEDLAGMVVHHRLDRPDLERVARGPHVDQECERSPRCAWPTAARGVVRASSSIRSECCARLVQIFWPLMR